MNKVGRRLIKSFVIGGAMFTGLYMNSVDSFAAEVETNDNQLQQTDETANQEAEQEDERLQKMEDATEVIEGDAVAEEGYCAKAEEDVANNSLDQEKVDELKKAGQDVMDQAKEKKAIVEEIYGEIKGEADAEESSLAQQAKDYGFGEQVEAFEAIEDSQKKIEYLDEFVDNANQQYQEYVKENGKDSEKYAELVKEIQEAEGEKEKAAEDYAKVVEEYNQLEEQRQKLVEELNRLEIGVSDFDKMEENQEYYNQQLEELNRLKAEFEKSCEKFDEIYYARAAYEEQVNQAGATRNDYLNKIREATAAEASNEELAAIVMECSTYIEKYNEAVAQLENWYNELESATSDRQTKKGAYDTQKTVVSDYEKTLANYANYKTLIDSYKEYENTLSDQSLKVEGAKATVDSVIEKIAELYGKKESIDNGFVNDRVLYDYCMESISKYRNSLINLSKAQGIYDRAVVAFTKTEEKYEDLNETIESYENPESPEEPDYVCIQRRDEVRSLYSDMYMLYVEIEETYNSIKTDYENGTLTQEKLDTAKKIINKDIEEAEGLYTYIRDTNGYYELTMNYVENEYSHLVDEYNVAKESLYYIEEEYKYNQSVYGSYDFLQSLYEESCEEHPNCIEPYKRYIEKVTPVEAEIKELNAEKEKIEKAVTAATKSYNQAVNESNEWENIYKSNKKRVEQLKKELDASYTDAKLKEYNDAVTKTEKIRDKWMDTKSLAATKLDELNNISMQSEARKDEINTKLEELTTYAQDLYNADKVYIEEYKEYIFLWYSEMKKAEQRDKDFVIQSEEQKKVIEACKEKADAYTPKILVYRECEKEITNLYNSSGKMIKTAKEYTSQVNQLG